MPGQKRAPDRAPVVRYLRRVAREANDRPRALAADILADTLARPRAAEPPPMTYVESRIRALAAEAGEDDTAAEVVYEVGSILVELQERFPAAPPPLSS